MKDLKKREKARTIPFKGQNKYQMLDSGLSKTLFTSLHSLQMQ